MQSLKRGLIVAGGFVALASIGSFMNSQNFGVLRAQNGNAQGITIAGPLPLPVTGSVSVSNTPNVNVANSPTVQVGNSAASPVLTKVLDGPAVQPFQFTTSGSQLLFSFAVPAGKTLVIEQVSMGCLEPSASAYITDFRLLLNMNGSTGTYLFMPTQVSNGLTTNLFAGGMTRIYASTGSLVTLGTGAGNPPGSNCGATVSGQLIPAP